MVLRKKGVFMDQNTKGTPSPLNQAPKTVGQTNRPTQTVPVSVSTPKTAPVARPMKQTVAPAAQPVRQAPAPAARPIGQTATPVAEPVAPEARPMEQAPAADGAPRSSKKKTGLIIAGVVALFLAIGCGVAATLLLLNPGGDPVATAVQRLMSGESGSKLAVNGTINGTFGDDSMVSDLNITLDGKADLMAKISSANIGISARLAGNDEALSINAEEISTGDGDLFIKLDNLSEAIENYGKGLNSSEPTTQIIEDCDLENAEDCMVDVTTMDSGSAVDISQYAVLFELFENKWFRISADDLTGDDLDMDTDTVQCLNTLYEDIKNSANSLSGVYKDYPFITSSTENITIAKRQNPIYRVIIDGENLANYLKVANDLPAMDSFRACAGAQNAEIDTEEIKNAIAEMPELYVEVDNNRNFTRLYTEFTIDGLDADITLDLNFSYPESVNVSEPTEYENFSDFMQKLSTAFSGSGENQLESNVIIGD